METEKKSAQAQRTNQRRITNIMIHRPMQREFSFMLILLFFVSSAAVAWVIHQTIRDAALGGGFYFGKVNPYQILSDVSYQIILRVALVLVFTLVFIAVYGIIFLHRVAGPVYRFRQTLLKLNRGEPVSEINLREGDFFHEVAHDINTIIHRFRAEETKLDELKAKINEIQRTGISEEGRLKTEEIKAVLDSFSKI